MGSKGDSDKNTVDKMLTTENSKTEAEELATEAVTGKPLAVVSEDHGDKASAEGISSAAAAAESKKRKERSEDDSTPSPAPANNKNYKATPNMASENLVAATSTPAIVGNPGGITDATTNPTPAQPNPSGATHPVHNPSPLTPTPGRSQGLAQKTVDDLPPEIRKVFLEIKSDPRWKFAFFPCGALMNLIRAHQREFLALFEQHFPAYCENNNNNKGRGRQTLSELVRDTILPQQTHWYMYADAKTGFVTLSDEDATKKILQKFRTMRKQRKHGTGSTRSRKKNKDKVLESAKKIAQMNYAVETVAAAAVASSGGNGGEYTSEAEEKVERAQFEAV